MIATCAPSPNEKKICSKNLFVWGGGIVDYMLESHTTTQMMGNTRDILTPYDLHMCRLGSTTSSS
jgi:hypothetical protein